MEQKYEVRYTPDCETEPNVEVYSSKKLAANHANTMILLMQLPGAKVVKATPTELHLRFSNGDKIAIVPHVPKGQ